MCPPGRLVVAGLTLTCRRWLTRRHANTIVTPDMEHLDTFLAGHPPFDALGSDELTELASQAVVREQKPGVVVLVEDGVPATDLWVVVTGSMDVMHSGEV